MAKIHQQQGGGDNVSADLVSLSLELQAITSVEQMGKLTNASRLDTVHRLRDFRKTLDVLPNSGKDAAARAQLAEEAAFLEDWLASPSPLCTAPLLFQQRQQQQAKKRHSTPIPLVLGFARCARLSPRPSSRLQQWPHPLKPSTELISHQQRLTRSYEQPIRSFYDLNRVLDDLQFGTHPLLQTGAEDILNLLVLSEERLKPATAAPGFSEKGAPKVPEVPLSAVAKEAPQQNQNRGKSPRKPPQKEEPRQQSVPPQKTKPGKGGKEQKQRKQQQQLQQVRPVDLGLDKLKECEQTGVRQDQIVLGWNLVVDEEKLKRDIKKELPNVCCVDIQYREDPSNPESFSSVLVFSYCEPTKADPPGKSLFEKQPPASTGQQKSQLINVGKEVDHEQNSHHEGVTARQYRGSDISANFKMPASTSYPAQKSSEGGAPQQQQRPQQRPSKPSRHSMTSVELLAYVVIIVVFIVPFCVFWWWLCSYAFT